MDEKIIYQSVGNNGISMIWPKKFCQKQLKTILATKLFFDQLLNEVILYSINLYNSYTIFYDLNKIQYDTIQQMLESYFLKAKTDKKLQRNLYRVPICLSAPFSMDWPTLAHQNAVEVSSAQSLFLANSYQVFFIGFLPGFLYLGPLPKALHLPRRATPRNQIARGAVGIGGDQLGIYPQASPGGWNIIGQTPILLFDPRENPPVFAQPLDRIRFYAIDASEYAEISELVRMGAYELEKEVIHV